MNTIGLKRQGMLSLLPVMVLLALAGCRHAPAPSRTVPPVFAPVSTVTPFATDAPLPLDLTREQLTELLLTRLQKRVLGRREGLRDVARIVHEIGPIVAASTRQPQAEAALRSVATGEGIALEEARARWIALQEADLLLESGGDPDAISPSYAEGVAQWLAGTGSGAGLHVDLKESRRLTRKITAVQWQIAWDAYLQRPDADPKAPGAPAMTPAQAAAQLPALRAEQEMLRAKRRRADGRYDPQQAIFAQTRYLLGLYPRFPSLDWLFQAYHGGVGGVQKLLRLYTGGRGPGAATVAIQSGRSGEPLHFEDLYFTTTTRSHTEAFSYLYGRGDDHRHYWWKLRTSAGLIALYRRDPEAVRRLWEASLPGRPTDALWYPDAVTTAWTALPDLQAAWSEKRVVPVPQRPEWRIRPAPFDPAQAKWYAALRPQALGALRLLTAVHTRAGGRKPLPVGDLALTREYVARARLLQPPPPPKPPLWPPDPEAKARIGGGPPADFDYHTTGIAFDLLRPANDRQRKTLEYALGYLEDRRIIAVVDAKDRNERRYHVVPNPRYGDALARIAATGKLPALPGL
jgi:hypothetical protein